jgi:hypothetical protein
MAKRQNQLVGRYVVDGRGDSVYKGKYGTKLKEETKEYKRGKGEDQTQKTKMCVRVCVCVHIYIYIYTQTHKYGASNEEWCKSKKGQ